MRSLSPFVAVAVLIACGGTTTAVDAGVDSGKKVACWGDARTQSDRTCTANQDCAVVDHTNDCCGTFVEQGVRVTEVNNVINEEAAANAGCNICKCPAGQTEDENGASGGAYIASCDDGLCTAHAQ